MNKICDWVCDDISLLENWLEKVRNNKDCEEYGNIVSIRSGALCFDLVEKKVENDFYLYAYLYVGGIDTGYGYSRLLEIEGDEYPYDYYEEGGADWRVDKIANEDADSILKIIEKELETKITEKSSEYEYCSLIEKASEELKIW